MVTRHISARWTYIEIGFFFLENCKVPKYKLRVYFYNSNPYSARIRS